MSLKEFLQGAWLGHPIHTALVHIPTALWPAALVFDVLTVLGIGGNPMVRTSYYCILAGLVVSLLAVPTGLADWWDIKPEKPARKLGLYHLGLNVVIVVIEAVNLYLRLGDELEATAVGATPLLLSVLAVGLLLVAGYLGGRMVYNYGTSVARLSKDKWRRMAEAGGANVPEEKS